MHFGGPVVPVEGQPAKWRRRTSWSREVAPQHGAYLGDVRRLGKTLHDDHRAYRRQARADLLQPVETVVLATAVPIAIGRDENLRPDLPEPVEHATAAEIGRRRGVHRADRCGRQRSDVGLGDVRQPGRDDVASLDTCVEECVRDRGYLASQLRPRRDRSGAVFSSKQQSRDVVGAREHRLSDVQRGVREETCIADIRRADERPTALVADDGSEIPDRRPEIAGTVERESLQGWEIRELDVVPARYEVPKRRHARCCHPPCGRRPQQVAVGHAVLGPTHKLMPPSTA